jgi:Serine acetyltransferase
MKASEHICYLKADVFRYTKSTTLKSIIKMVLFNKSFRPIFTMRMCQYFSPNNTLVRKIFLALFKLFHRIFCHRAGVSLNWRTNIGPGFRLTHGWGTVINENAVIGSNVTIFNGVTIGTKHVILENGDRIPKYPTINDNVWIGPNAVVVGDVIVEKGSIIAPLAMVNKSVKCHTVVGCNPLRVLREDAIEDVFNKAPLDQLLKK